MSEYIKPNLSLEELNSLLDKLADEYHAAEDLMKIQERGIALLEQLKVSPESITVVRALGLISSITLTFDDARESLEAEHMIPVITKVIQGARDHARQHGGIDIQLELAVTDQYLAAAYMNDFANTLDYNLSRKYHDETLDPLRETLGLALGTLNGIPSIAYSPYIRLDGNDKIYPD